jgi:putative PIN family toxin of toxin-antitoxin system
MLKLVMDTDVMVSAFDSPTGASRALLLAVLNEEARLLLSTPLLFEYESVLTRPAIVRMTGLDAHDIRSVLDEVAGLCQPVARNFSFRPVARDPDDDMVLETAITGGADILATFNLKDMRTGAERFGIRVMRPADALRRIRA